MPDDHARSTLGRLLSAEIEESADAVLAELLGTTPGLPEPAPPAGPAAPRARHDYDSVLDDLARFARALRSDLAAQAESAEAAWRELERHPPARRLILVRHRRGLHSWGLFALLVRASRRLAPEDPREARHRLELALELASRLRHPWLSRRHIEDLRAACHRGLAEAACLLGETARAAAALGQAWQALERGTGDLLERAHLLRLEARLAAGAGRRGAAARRLAAAGSIYRRLREGDLAVRTTLDRAKLAGHSDPRLGAGLLRDALASGGEMEPRLALAVKHQLAWFVNDLEAREDGEPAVGPFAARRLVAELRPAYLGFSDAAATVHRRWLEGRILRNLELLDEAAARLEIAAQALAELGAAQDLLLCELDRLELYGHAGRAADVARLDLSCRRRLAAWGARGPALAVWSRAVESCADRAAMREIALLVRDRGHRLLQPG